MYWLSHFLGLDNLSGPYYGFWSGVGSDLAEVTLVGAMLTLVRKYNCHVKWCWRVGRHPVEGTTYTVCRRHHPEGKPTAADIQAKWHLYIGHKPGKG